MIHEKGKILCVIYYEHDSREIVKTIGTRALPTAHSGRRNIDVHILRCTPCHLDRSKDRFSGRKVEGTESILRTR